MYMKRAAGGPSSQPGGRRGSGTGKRPGPLLNNALAAIKSFNAAGLEQTLNRASTELSGPAFLQQTVAPLIEQIVIHWQTGHIEAIQEHLATAVIGTFLGNLMHDKALGKMLLASSSRRLRTSFMKAVRSWPRSLQTTRVGAPFIWDPRSPLIDRAVACRQPEEDLQESSG